MMICPYKVHLGTTSGHLESENSVDSPCKRHHRSTLVFFPPCFASRGARVRVPPRPPTIFLRSILMAFNSTWSKLHQMFTQPGSVFHGLGHWFANRWKRRL